MADNRDFIIKIRVDEAGAASVLDELSGEFRRLKGEAEESGSSITRFERAIVVANQGIGLLSKAVELAAGAFNSTIDAIKRGSDISDAREVFDAITDAAGEASSVLLDELRTAVGGTVADLDLMRKASENMRAGLKPDEVIELTKAARVLSETTGKDLTSAMDALSMSLLKGDDRFLKSIGIVIDNKAALDNFAVSIGTTTDKLTELERVEAIRAATLETLRKKTEEFGVIQDDAADSIERVSVAFRNAKDAAFEQIASNEDVQAALRELADAATEAGKVLAEIGEVVIPIVVDAFKTGVEWAGALADKLRAFKLGGEEALAAAKQIDAVAEAQKKAAKAAASLQEISKRELDGVFNGERMKWTRLEIERVERQLNTLETELKSGRASYGEFGKVLDQTKINLERWRGQVEKTPEPVRAARQEVEKFTSVAEKTQALDRLGSSTEKVWGAFRSGLIPAEEMRRGIEELRVEFEKLGGTSNEALSQMGQSLHNAESKFLGLGNSIKGSDAKGALSGWAADISDVFEVEISENMGQAINAGLDLAMRGLSGETLHSGDYGGTIGSIVGQQFGGPAGARLGQAVGDLLFSGLRELFNDTDSAGTAAKKGLDRFFAELLDANNFKAVIDGKLTTIEDLFFEGMTPFGGESQFSAARESWAGFLDSLDAETASTFQGVGLAFEQLQGVAEAFSNNAGYLGAVFANNLGGDLNALQLLIQATGKSFEDMAQAAVDAFLNGEVSALQAFDSLQAIKVIAEDGIPGALGAVTTAFDNLVAAGVKGGRVSVDALKDIGFEAIELGKKTLEEVRELLVSSGKYTASEIEGLFASLASNGIDSIEELTAATDEDLIGVLAQLERTEFPFAEAVQDARDLVDAVKNLPKEVESTLKVRVVAEGANAGGQQIINSGFLSNVNYGPGVAS